MKSPSLRVTLLIRCGIGVGALLCTLSMAIYWLVRQSLYDEIDQSITQTAALLANQVELENGSVIFEWQEGLGTNNELILDGLFQFWDNHSGKTTRSPALGTQDLPKFAGKNGNHEIRNIMLPNGQHGRALGLEVHPFILPEELQKMRESGHVIDPMTMPHTLVVAGQLEPLNRSLAHLRYILFSGTLLTLALGFALIDHAIRITLHPINLLSREVQDRTEHQLDNSLELPDALPSEISGLAKNFNALLARVSALRQRERDFIRHASHELRTPIAGLHATAELALSKPRDATAYAQFLGKCRDSAEELKNLVNKLSALSRIGKPAAASAKLEPILVQELVGELLPSFATIAIDRGIRITTSGNLKTRWIGDRTLCRIILSNLLDNATSYAPANETIEIACTSKLQQITLCVSNRTENLKDDPSRLFEPLFRANQSDPGNGHLGIGLALSLDAAHAMGGTLDAHLRPDGWISFSLCLPSAEP